jgi:hypothetical protein
MVAGVPRQYDRIEIGKEFVEWATNNPQALTVPMFAVSKGMNSGILRNWANEDPEFRALFQQAKEQIGINRLKMTLSDSPIKLDCGIYKQTIGHYDMDSKAEMREEKAYDSSLRKDEEGSKATTIHLTASHDLTAGLNISTSPISSKDNKGSK